MVFVCPITYRFYHELAHHRVVAGRFVPACRTIIECAVRLHPEEIVRDGTFERTIGGTEYMIIHHIQHHTYAGTMQGHDHLLKFADACIWIGGVGRVGTLRDIIILRVIPPVVFIIVQFCFINRGKIERGEQMHMRNAQLFQVVYTC